jgi:hypothetical protein
MFAYADGTMIYTTSGESFNFGGNASYNTNRKITITGTGSDIKGYVNGPNPNKPFAAMNCTNISSDYTYLVVLNLAAPTSSSGTTFLTSNGGILTYNNSAWSFNKYFYASPAKSVCCAISGNGNYMTFSDSSGLIWIGTTTTPSTNATNLTNTYTWSSYTPASQTTGSGPGCALAISYTGQYMVAIHESLTNIYYSTNYGTAWNTWAWKGYNNQTPASIVAAGGGPYALDMDMSGVYIYLSYRTYPVTSQKPFFSILTNQYY